MLNNKIYSFKLDKPWGNKLKVHFYSLDCGTVVSFPSKLTYTILMKLDQSTSVSFILNNLNEKIGRENLVSWDEHTKALTTSEVRTAYKNLKYHKLRNFYRQNIALKIDYSFRCFLKLNCWFVARRGGRVYSKAKTILISTSLSTLGKFYCRTVKHLMP